jgi:predicted TPR repeat methyltransferase
LAPIPHTELEVRIAPAASDQDEEWCEVHVDGEVRRIRFHDYAEVFSVPGLYERLFHEELECDSPLTVCELLGQALAVEGDNPSELTVLDVGAGNGMVGEQLVALGADSVVGVDIIEAAAAAAARDRPGVYDDYRVLDLTDIGDDDARELRDYDFNCMTTVAALGFGDIPPAAFATAYGMLATDGWLAFNIKEEFVAERDRSGFSALILGGFDDGSLELKAQSRYRHRLATDGDPIHYVAMVARKRGELELTPA